MDMIRHINTVFKVHEQFYLNSCAASGMELVLKIHALVPLDFRDFQDLYKDENIGFEKLFEMSRFGVSASDHEKPLNVARAIIRAEFMESRYPLVSLPNQQGCWHIWIAVPNGKCISFLSRAFGNNSLLAMDDSAIVTQILDERRQGNLHFVTYKTTEAEQDVHGNTH